MGYLHYGEQFAAVRCSFFNAYDFSIKSGRYAKKTIAIHSVVFQGIYKAGGKEFPGNRSN